MNFDLERMKLAVCAKSVKIPKGIRGNELRLFILGAAKSKGRDDD